MEWYFKLIINRLKCIYHNIRYGRIKVEPGDIALVPLDGGFGEIHVLWVSHTTPFMRVGVYLLHHSKLQMPYSIPGKFKTTFFALQSEITKALVAKSWSSFFERRWGEFFFENRRRRSLGKRGFDSKGH